jgi:hypothetical protein
MALLNKTNNFSPANTRKNWFYWKNWHVAGILLATGILFYGLYVAQRDLKKVLAKMKRDIPADNKKE